MLMIQRIDHVDHYSVGFLSLFHQRISYYAENTFVSHNGKLSYMILNRVHRGSLGIGNNSIAEKLSWLFFRIVFYLFRGNEITKEVFFPST